MIDQHITKHDYGGKVETSCQIFVDGFVELLDDLADFSLSRIINRVYKANLGSEEELLPQEDIDHFKLTWYVSLAELMFFSMREQPKLQEIKSEFYRQIELTATDRDAYPFLVEARISIPKLIQNNADFVERGIFNSTMNNRDSDTSRNRGLGPELANTIIETSFISNIAISKIYDEIIEIFTQEFNNAYGHCSLSCSKFLVT